MAISVRALFAVALLGVAARVCDAGRRPAPPGAKKYNLIFFGDSLTDVGNSLKAAGVPDPKIYYKGRFTNGPNWADHLKNALSRTAKVQVRNYAVASATACANPIVEAAVPFAKNLDAQVATFAADVKRKRVKLANSKTLVLQYIGSNDLLFFFESLEASNSTASPEQIATLISSTVTCRVQSAAALAAIPGVTDIALLPVAPVHTSPTILAAVKPELIALQDIITAQTVAAVAALNAELAAAGSAVKVYLIGDYKWIVNAASRVDPPFTETDKPCFWQPKSALLITPGLKTCKDPENYFFYDQVHPTTRFHDAFVNKGLLPRLQTLGLLV